MDGQVCGAPADGHVVLAVVAFEPSLQWREVLEQRGRREVALAAARERRDRLLPLLSGPERQHRAVRSEFLAYFINKRCD